MTYRVLDRDGDVYGTYSVLDRAIAAQEEAGPSSCIQAFVASLSAWKTHPVFPGRKESV